MAPLIPLLLKFLPTVMKFIQWAGDMFKELSKQRAIAYVRQRKIDKDSGVDAAFSQPDGVRSPGGPAEQQSKIDAEK